jgi:hypothetical protein
MMGNRMPSIYGRCQRFHEALNCDYRDRRFHGRVATDMSRFPSSIQSGREA